MFDLFHVGDADLDRTNLRSLKDPVESAREDRSLELHPALRGDLPVKQGFSFRFYVGSASAEVTVDRYFPLNVLDQLKEEVCADLQAEADSQFFNAAGSELLNEVINNSEVTADPDAVDDMFNQLKTTYSSYASSYGMDFDQFLSMFLGTDEDGLRDTAENLVKQQLVLDAIQAQENLSATEDQKDKLAVMNYFKNAAQMTATYGEDSSNQIFDMGAVYYYLIDNSTYVEAPETTAETTEAENILEEAETVAEESESSTEAK